MPTYYEEDLSEDELSALISYLKTLRNPTSMPVEGKFQISGPGGMTQK